MRIVVAALAASLVALLATAPRAELLRHIDGDARSLAGRSFARPGASDATFILESSGLDLDLRSNPGALLLVTRAGLLIAEATLPTRRFERWRFDSASGRPLRRDAIAGAACATGAEASCWRPGDPVPYSDEVADALSFRPIPLAQSQPVTLAPDFLTRTPIPLVRLNVDPCDGFLSNGLGGCTPIPARSSFPARSSNSVLTDEQEALMGCGPFWGTDCELDGIDLRNAESSVVMQSWVGFEGSYASEADPFTSWLYTSTDAPTPSKCRFQQSLSIPCANLGGALGSGGYGTAPGPTFASEMAALSFNFQNLLVAFSTQAGVEQPEDGVDRTALQPNDPFSQSPGQCSFRQPQYCANIQDFFAHATLAEPLDDDPDGASQRWIWDAGAEYQIINAWGDVEDYAGGRIHILGVEHSRTRFATTGIPIVLFPASGAQLDPEAPFATPPTSGATTSTLGLAYLTAPEPSDAALTSVAIAALLCLARRSPMNRATPSAAQHPIPA